jgi:hypothetical protein
MATNNNGNLLDSAGEVAIDFVWGNFPIQPNDARPDAASATLSTTVTTRVAGRLDPAADNHIIALSGWNGFPLYNPNTAGEDVVGATDYVLVPSRTWTYNCSCSRRNEGCFIGSDDRFRCNQHCYTVDSY